MRLVKLLENEKKRYWLKIEKDFLKSTHIKVIKNLPNGKDYILFYLALMLESVETIGHLKFSEVVPYNEEMLAAITDINIDVVRSAVKIFVDLGLIQFLEDGTIFLPNVPKMTGKEGESTERVRRFREKKNNVALLCNGEVTNCNDNKEKEEQEQIKEEEQENKNKNKIYNEIYNENESIVPRFVDDSLKPPKQRQKSKKNKTFANNF